MRRVRSVGIATSKSRSPNAKSTASIKNQFPFEPLIAPRTQSTPGMGGRRRHSMLATTALTAGVLLAFVVMAPNAARAANISTSNNTEPEIVSVDTATATTNTNQTDNFNTTNNLDRSWVYTTHSITGNINAAVTGFGISFDSTVANGGVTVNQNASVSGAAAAFPNASVGTGALGAFGSGGTVTVNVNGNSITSTNATGIYTTNTGSGAVNVTTGASTISVGDNAGADNYGIRASSVSGNIVINAASSSIVGQVANGMGDSAGISATSSTGDVNVTANTIGASAADRAAIGVTATQTGNLSTNSVSVTTGAGNIFSTATGVIAQIGGLASTGNVFVTQGTGAINSSGNYAINASISQANSTGDVTVGVNGNLTGFTGGVSAQNSGLGNISVTSVAGTTILSPAGIGINAQAARGSVTIDSSSVIGAAGAGQVALGINAQVTNTAGSGPVSVTQNGNIFATTTGINATNAGLGGVIVNQTGGTIAMTGGTGIAALVTGGGGGVTVTVGGGIDPPVYGVTAVINNSGNSSNVAVHANAAITTNGVAGTTGIVANTDGTGNIRVDGSAAVTGGSGAFAAINPTALNYGIFAQQSGSSGNITINGTGATSGTVAIGAYVGGTGNFNTSDLSQTINTGAGGGTITISRSGTTTSTGTNGIGIDARVFAGAGEVKVLGVGNITTDAGGLNVTGINAITAEGGNVTVNGTGTIGASGGGTMLTGINAQSQGAGNVTVQNTGLIAATIATGFGINASSNGGNIIVTPGSAVNGDTGIQAVTNGTGTVTIDSTAGAVSGNVSATGQGIIATTASGTIGITTGAVNGNANGVNANSSAGGAVTVTTQGNVNGDADANNTGTGIIAHQAGGNGAVSVSSLGTVSGASGIDAQAAGNGDVTVHTGSGAAGNVTGTAGFGISAVGVNGSQVLVTADNVGANNAQTVTGTTFGITASSSGTAPVTVTGNALVSTANAGATAAISAVETGAGPGAGLNGVRVTGTGNTDASIGGTGIIATINNAGNASNILVDRSGTIQGAADGINAEIQAGTGNVSVTGVGNVTAGTGTGIIAKQSGATNTTGSVTVTPNGTVSGANGIDAEVAFGAGTVTVTTANGAAGNVTGNAGFGINTSAVNGNTVVTNNAVQVSGTTSADNSTATGTGTLTITGAGNYVGGTVAGIKATLTGANPATTDGIIISGTGNTSATTGVGIDAQITNAGNSTDIHITRSGTVTVTNAAGGSGINATTIGGGDIVINGVGNVTGGTGAGVFGINATSSGGNGNVSVTPAGTVSGGTGINTSAVGTGTSLVQSGFDVTGAAGNGITTSTVDGNNTVNVTAGTINATADGINATSSGAGNIVVNMTGGQVGAAFPGGPVGDQGVVAISNATGTGNVDVTTTTIFSTGDGVRGEIQNAASSGHVVLTGNGPITVNSGAGSYGMIGKNAGLGLVAVTSNGAIDPPLLDGMRGEITNAGNASAVTVTSNANIDAGQNGMAGLTQGTGVITISANGAGNHTTGDANGIFASMTNAGNASAINITAQGAVTGNGTAFAGARQGYAEAPYTTGLAAFSTPFVPSVPTNGIGIAAYTAGTGTIDITAAAVTGRYLGIGAITDNAGTTAHIIINANGAVNGTDANSVGIGAISSGASPITITTGSTVTAGDIGIYAETQGVGTITVDSRAGLVTAVGTAGANGIATNAVAGATIIHAGAVTANNHGIRAQSSGGGAITVDTTGVITADADNSGAGIGINAQQTGGNGAVSVTPGAAVSGATGIFATAQGTGTVTVNSAFNVTASNGIGIQTTAINGLTTVNMTGGTISATSDGINAQSTGTGSIHVNLGGGAIGVSGTPVGGFGVVAVQSGAASGGITIDGTGTPIFSTNDGINATISHNGAGNILITQNSAITTVGTGVAGEGDGISAFINNAGATGTITVNANANITANTAGTDVGTEGIRTNNLGSGASTVNVASGITILGDPGIKQDTAGGNALVTVNNNDTVSGAVGIINRQNGAAGPGYATVTVGSNSTITGDNSSTTAVEPLTGYGLYNLNKSTASTGAGTQNSFDSAFVVFGGAGNTVNARGDVQNVVVSGIFNQSYGSSAVVDTGGFAQTINVRSGAVGGSSGINNSTASTTASDLNSVLFTGASAINLRTDGSNGNTGIVASNILSASNGNVPPATIGNRPIIVTTGTSSTINVTAAGTTTTSTAAGAGNTGIAAVSGAGSTSTINVTTGTSSAINVGAGSIAGTNSIGILGQSAGSGLITVTTGDSSSITVGLGDASRGVWGRATSTSGVTLTTGTGTTITLSDSTTGGSPVNGSNAVRADSTSGAININIGNVAAGTSTLNVGGTAGGAVVRAESTGGAVTVTTQSGATLDSAGTEGRGIFARQSGGGTNAITVTNNGVIGTNAATRVGLTGIVADQNNAVVQTGNISVTNSSTGRVFAGTDGITAGSSVVTPAGSNADVTVSNAGLVDANQRGVFMGLAGQGTAGDAVVVTLNNTGTIIGGRSAGAGNNTFTALDVANANTAVVGGTAVQTTINNTGNGTTTGIIQGAGLGDATTCTIAGVLSNGCNPTVYVHTASGANLNNNGGLITDLNNNPASRGTLALYFVSPGASTNTITNTGTIIGRAQFSAGTDLFNNNAGGVWSLTNGGSAGQTAANFGDTANLNKITNAGTINAYGTTTIINLPRFDNSGTFNAGDASTSVTSISTDGVVNADNTITGPAAAGGITQIVNNTGTMNVQGKLRFISDATFNNAGGLIDMRTGSHVTTDYMTLNTNIGTGAASNTYTPGAAYSFTGGANSRLGLDTFIGGVASTGANVPSDRLVISGNGDTLAALSPLATGIRINDTNGPTGGAYNPIGITLVGVNGSSTNAFNLTAITCNGVDITGYCSATGDLLQANRGPMGAIKKGFWFYPLLQSTHAEAVADGLTGANSTEYRLYGLPDIEVFQLAKLTTGMQNIFFTTTGDWLDRQNDLHHWIRRGQERSGNAAGGGADKASPGYLSSTGPGVWLKGTGSWTTRSSSVNLADLVPAAGVLPLFDVGYKQNTYSVQGGVDFGREAMFRPADAMVFGVMGGYIDSTMKFNGGTNSFQYTGGTVGASATYLNNGWFADALFKADFLRVSLNMPSLTQFGFNGPSLSARNLGGLGNLGYRYERGRWYVEPALTVAYVRTTVDGFNSLGTGITFPTGESFRGAAGARIGMTVQQTATRTLDVSVTGRFWDEFTSKGGVTLNTTGPALTISDPHTKTYGEVQGLVDLANSGTGWSGFVMGGALFNSQNTTITGKVGTRYQW